MKHYLKKQWKQWENDETLCKKTMRKWWKTMNKQWKQWEHDEKPWKNNKNNEKMMKSYEKQNENNERMMKHYVKNN
jgi:hypothetical protein